MGAKGGDNLGSIRNPAEQLIGEHAQRIPTTLIRPRTLNRRSERDVFPDSCVKGSVCVSSTWQVAAAALG